MTARLPISAQPKRHSESENEISSTLTSVELNGLFADVRISDVIFYVFTVLPALRKKTEKMLDNGTVGVYNKHVHKTA